MTGLGLEKRMVDGRNAGRREADAGLQRLRWFLVIAAYVWEEL